MATSIVRMQQRRDSTADWESNDPILLPGEVGYDTTTHQIKIGDGTSTWTELLYANLTLEDISSGVADAITEPGPAKDALTSSIAQTERTFTKPQVFESDATDPGWTVGDHPLNVLVDKDDGLGLLERFTVENTPGLGGCDVNFRNVDVNFGLHYDDSYQVGTKYYMPDNLGYHQPIRVYKPGSITDLSGYIDQNGAFYSYAKGLASGPAYGIAAWGEANAIFTVGAPDGKLRWGPGGATALDTSLERTAANTLKTPGTFITGVLKAAADPLYAQGSGGTTLFQMRNSDTLFTSLTYHDLDAEFTDTSKGPVLKSPDGTRYRIKVANGGAVSAVAA